MLWNVARVCRKRLATFIVTFALVIGYDGGAQGDAHPHADESMWARACGENGENSSQDCFLAGMSFSYVRYMNMDI